MNEEVHKLLLQIDRPATLSSTEVYSGEDIDTDEARIRAQSVRRDPAREFRRYFYLRDDQQDAFLWGGISEPHGDDILVTRPITIRFSFCGNLAASWTVNGYESLTPTEKEKVAAILASLGFIWVDGDELRSSTYDGVYDFFKMDHYNAPATWWDRFSSMTSECADASSLISTYPYS